MFKKRSETYKSLAVVLKDRKPLSSEAKPVKGNWVGFTIDDKDTSETMYVLYRHGSGNTIQGVSPTFSLGRVYDGIFGAIFNDAKSEPVNEVDKGTPFIAQHNDNMYSISLTGIPEVYYADFTSIVKTF